MYEWKNISEKYYFYDKRTGKICGVVQALSLQSIWIAVSYVGEYTFTIDDEKHLGQYIDSDYAKRAVEFFWDVRNRTLIAEN